MRVSLHGNAQLEIAPWPQVSDSPKVISERLTRLCSTQETDWPHWFVCTSHSALEYLGQSFARSIVPKTVRDMPLPVGFNEVVVEVRGDGESAVVLLENGNAIVFEIRVAMPPFRSALVARLVEREDFLKWKDEYVSMESWTERPDRTIGAALAPPRP